MSNYPFKTNEWVEEDVDITIKSPVINEKTKKVEIVEETKTIKQKTFYSDSPHNTVVCNNHVYTCTDKGKYLFKCNKCSWSRIAPPVSFKFDESTGILTRRSNGVQV